MAGIIAPIVELAMETVMEEMEMVAMVVMVMVMVVTGMAVGMVDPTGVVEMEEVENENTSSIS